jgi:hypothetical protein
MTHDELVEAARAAIGKVGSDQSVPPSQNLASLEDLEGDIETIKDALRDDIRRDEEDAAKAGEDGED